jgi:hypothetical protein
MDLPLAIPWLRFMGSHWPKAGKGKNKSKQGFNAHHGFLNVGI